QNGSRAAAAAGLQTNFFQNTGNRVTDCRSRCERQVDDAKRYAQTFGRDRADQLTHTGDLKCGLLDDLCDLTDRAVTSALDCRLDNTRAGNADVDNGLRLTDTVECASHERVVIDCVCKYNQLCAAHRTVILS